MRFLIDENLPPVIATHLRAAGHDARTMTRRELGMLDPDVVALAAAEDRIIVTRDKGLATTAFTGPVVPAGVILFRVPNIGRHELARFAVSSILARIDWTGLTATVSERSTRRRRLPRSGA